MNRILLILELVFLIPVALICILFLYFVLGAAASVPGLLFAGLYVLNSCRASRHF